MFRELSKHVGPTFGANVFNQVVIVVAQLVVVPVLIQSWGMSGFGAWVVLSAIPGYLSISDFGFSYSAKSDMSLRAARGDTIGVVTTFSSVIALTVVLLGGVSIFYVLLTYLLNWPALLDLASLSLHEIRAILLFGLIQIGGFQFTMLLGAALRASGRPALEVLLAAGLRLIETVMLAVTAIATRNMVWAACAWAMSRLVFTCCAAAVIYAAIPSIRPRFGSIQVERVRELFLPSVAYMAQPLANALIIQGTTLVIGGTLGVVLVASFATLRTVTRLGVSGSNMLTFSFVPQYSYAIGGGQQTLFIRLLSWHYRLLFVGTLVYVSLMILFGGVFIDLLSHHQAAYSYAVLIVMVLAAVFEMLWGPAYSVGAATNNVVRISSMYALLCGLGVAMSIPASSQFGLIGVAVVVAVVQGTMLVYCSSLAGRRPVPQ